MNDLEKYFRENNSNLVTKWIHYFDIYDKHFKRFRGREIVVLEIGVFHGGSLKMWKDYFGKDAKIYGIDINPNCKAFEEENIKVFIGSQGDKAFLSEVRKSIPKIDILIDDGSHKMSHQIITCEEMFDHIKDDGVYLCEDVHTSYWLNYGGGHKRRGTFIEYSKNFIDLLNAHHSEQKSLQVNKFTESVDSIHYYDSVVVIEKKKRNKPYYESTGDFQYQDVVERKSPLVRIIRRNGLKVLKIMNRVFRFFRMQGFGRR
ncbi:MAG TPA: class I SAM-dependent methyltransferase [Bacteroidia bacterium]|nr:class I SAM-dependent methyltransferase [Bacteroidia bacterium]